MAQQQATAVQSPRFNRYLAEQSRLAALAVAERNAPAWRADNRTPFQRYEDGLESEAQNPRLSQTQRNEALNALWDIYYARFAADNPWQARFLPGRNFDEMVGMFGMYLAMQPGPQAQSMARTARTWPVTAEEMDQMLGMEGTRVPDAATTPGRGKVIWQPNTQTKITFEQHPYHSKAPDWHKGPHWHLDTPTCTHERFVPGDAVPGT